MSTSDAVKQPRRHQETEAEIGGGYEDVEDVGGRLANPSSGRRSLYSSKSEGEEDEGADELKKGPAEILFDVREEIAGTRRHGC